jgi:ubiquinone/menaquinone biosynthesis C-methylase UbiE
LSLATEKEIQSYYASHGIASAYVQHRFVSELYRLLHDRQVAAVQRAIDRFRPVRTLEVAPGPGRLTRSVKPTGQLFCLEFNTEMIEQGRRACNPDSCIWIRGDAFELPFAEADFDLAYSFRFVRHFREHDRRRLYAEIRRVLKPGGHFIMDAINARISEPLRRQHPDEYPVYDKLYSPDELRAELSVAGLDVVRMEPVQKRFGWQSRSQVLLGPRADWLNRLVIRMLEWCPGRSGLEWIVTCRRA